MERACRLHGRASTSEHCSRRICFTARPTARPVRASSPPTTSPSRAPFRSLTPSGLSLSQVSLTSSGLAPPGISLLPAFPCAGQEKNDFHSGYNEVIVNSRALNAALPQAIEAFFVLKGSPTRSTVHWYSAAGGAGMDPTEWDSPTLAEIDVVDAHRRFLKEYGLSAEEVRAALAAYLTELQVEGLESRGASSLS